MARHAQPKRMELTSRAEFFFKEPFTWMESVVILATLAQKWRLGLVPGHPVEPHTLITLRPKYGMLMKIQPR